MRGLSLKTVFGTILALTTLQVISSSSAAAGRVGGALQGLGNATRYLLAPDVPLVPDLRASASARPGYQPTPQAQQNTQLPNFPAFGDGVGVG